MKVLHISPHVGGGVGSVLKGFLKSCRDRDIENSLLCLDYCNSNFNDITSVKTKIEGILFRTHFKAFIENKVSQVDVVLLHYWNHPLVTKLFSECNLSNSPLIIWCHNSGLFEPHIVPAFLTEMAEKVLFSSSCSYNVANLQTKFIASPQKFGVVHSTRDLDEFLAIGSARRYSKTIKKLLFVGTVSGSKMNSESAKIFSELSQHGFSIQVVGGPDNEKLASAVRSHGGDLEVLGELEDVVTVFQNADLFIYPLRPDHYGTGEQVILEAMAAGLPIIAFDNPAERAVLEQGGGELVSNAREFVKSVLRLRSGRSKYYQSMSAAGINRVRSVFNVEQMTNQLINFLEEIAGRSHLDSAAHRSYGYPSIQLNELSLYALHSFFDGEGMIMSHVDDLYSLEQSIFEKIRPFLNTSDGVSKWCGSIKSTPFHYQRYFPDNMFLNSLCKRIIAESDVTDVF